MTTASPLPTDEDARDEIALAEIIDAVDDGKGGSEVWQNIFPQERDQIVDAILAAGFRRSVVSTPSRQIEHVRELMDRHRYREPFECSGCEWSGNSMAGHRRHVAEVAVSAVSTPPSSFSITDEMVERAAAVVATEIKYDTPDDWEGYRCETKRLYRDIAKSALRAALGEAHHDD